ncbi:hypothetical protein Tco_1067476 [Tanacetum coccineum]|uniref:Uncharacterized protein n=1 Tax=Tanacetum coccineum TaxID=301880 RepID=A0ABQ5HDV6_9ASTR
MLNFLRSLPSEWDTHVVVWMNKPDFDTMGLDDLYNNFKIVEQKVKKSIGTNNDDKNLAFLTTSGASSTNTANPEVSTGNTKVNTASTEQLILLSFSDASICFLSTQPPRVLNKGRRMFYPENWKRKISLMECSFCGYDNQSSSKAVVKVMDWKMLLKRAMSQQESLMGLLRELKLEQPTTVCDKESDNSKENTDDSLKQQQKTDSSSVKSPLKLNDKGFIDSGCSRHMTGNIAHLSNFKDFDGGYVTFGGGASMRQIITVYQILFNKTGNLDFVDNSGGAEEGVVRRALDRSRVPVYGDQPAVLAPPYDTRVIQGGVSRRVSFDGSILRENGTADQQVNTARPDIILWRTHLLSWGITDLEKPLVQDGDAAKVDEHLYRSMIVSLMYLTTSSPDIMFAVCACARFQDSLLELVAYTNSDYAGATQDRKSTTGGCSLDTKPTAGLWKSRLWLTIDGHSMTITEASLRRHLKLDDQDGITSIPNSEIFEQLALMGYHTESDKLNLFKKGAFSPQWRFLISQYSSCLAQRDCLGAGFCSTHRTADWSIGVLEDDLRKTKKTYSSAFTKLILRGRKLSDAEVQEKASTETEPFIQEVTPTEVIQDQGSSEKGSAKVSTAGATKGTASEAQIEPRKKSKKELEQERLSFAEAIRLEEQMNEEQRAQIARDEEIARQWDEEERQRAMSEAKSTKKIDWNDPSVIRYHALKMKPKTVAQARRNMIKYLKNQGNYKISDFKGMSYNEIRPIFEKVWDFNQHIEPMEHGSEKMKSPEKIEEEDVDTQEEMKEVVKESGAKRKKSLPRKRRTDKRQKLEEDAEKEELKGFLDIIPREEFAEDVESLSTKYPIVDWKTYTLTGIFIGVVLISQRKNGIAIHMLTEKKYPLSQEMISKMLKKKLEVDHESSQAFELLRIMSSITAQQTKLDLELVPKENRLDIGKCNGRIPRRLTPREPTFQVVLDVIALTPCYPTFLITADVPEIFPRVLGRDFDSLPSEEDNVSFLRELGYTGRSIHSTMWWSINCISPRELLLLLPTGVYLERLVIENRVYKKQEKMYYPRFTQVIIHHFFIQEKSLSWRNKIGMLTSKDDYLINSLRFVSAKELTQIYRDILPECLTSPAMKESKAYKTYLSYATGVVPPKIARKFKKASPSKKDSDLVPVDEEPVQKGKRVKRPAKKSITKPAAGVVIREAPMETKSKSKEKEKVMLK